MTYKQLSSRQTPGTTLCRTQWFPAFRQDDNFSILQSALGELLVLNPVANQGAY